MARTKTNAAVFTAPVLPEAGARIGSVDGPGVFPRDNAGTVICQIDNQWGSHVLVMMDDGTTKTCHGMNSGPGIGWHYL
jgi:hypothetical protein